MSTRGSGKFYTKIDPEIKTPVYVVSWIDDTWCWLVEDLEDISGLVEEWNLDDMDDEYVHIFDSEGRRLGGRIDIASCIDLYLMKEGLTEDERKERFEIVKIRVHNAERRHENRPSWMARWRAKLFGER
ncbi:MAG: hypothetical protein JST35_05630 [Armatimonadetes bacterium]|nr:hypothetical protein [Armatimonadota bacterium]